MRYRQFGRTGWKVSELGYGMWGIADWSGSDDTESLASLQLAVDSGCNFFDTAWAYGDGHSERLLGKLLAANHGKRLYAATKVPPKNRTWPSERGFRLEDVFPPDYIREYADRSLTNLGVSKIDLLQFHVWEDDWAEDTRWQNVITDLKRQGLIEAVGVSINRWEPANALRTLRTGVVDAVQVIYNIFDQAPEDELFPRCRELNVGVIARVPFDEGSLTGTLRRDSQWPRDDYRATYFGPENLGPTIDRVERLEQLLPRGMPLAEVALRFILSSPDVDVVIPGMRKPHNVRANLAAADAGALDRGLIHALRQHRWDREPAPWSA
ncbi:MAG TPA: aldo/keto reductase [Gemmatimonadaceae bacterium]|nr:aldo/keto reductase [Gemmatimonadaceae bacterium]